MYILELEHKNKEIRKRWSRKFCLNFGVKRFRIRFKEKKSGSSLNFINYIIFLKQ